MRLIILSIFFLAFTVGKCYSRQISIPVNVNSAAIDCVTLFDNLTAVTSGATSLTSKEQSGLFKISVDARNLYDLGKTADALKKLYDYQVKLDQLAESLNTPKPKISLSDEQALRQALNEVIGCVSGN